MKNDERMEKQMNEFKNKKAWKYDINKTIYELGSITTSLYTLHSHYLEGRVG